MDSKNMFSIFLCGMTVLLAAYLLFVAFCKNKKDNFTKMDQELEEISEYYNPEYDTSYEPEDVPEERTIQGLAADDALGFYHAHSDEPSRISRTYKYQQAKTNHLSKIHRNHMDI